MLEPCGEANARAASGNVKSGHAYDIASSGASPAPPASDSDWSLPLRGGEVAGEWVPCYYKRYPAVNGMLLYYNLSS